MWVYDRATSRILAVNNQAISHYGYSRREFLEMKIENLIIQTPDYDSISEPQARTPTLTIQTHRKKDRQGIIVEISFFQLHFQGRDAGLALRSEERREGKGSVGRCRLCVSPLNKKKKI